MFCRNCGHELNENERFCGNCGARRDINLYSNVSSLDNLSRLKNFYKKYKLIIIITICVILGVILSREVWAINEKNNGYKKCIEEHIEEFADENSYTVDVDYGSLYYEDITVEDYELAIEGIVTYTQSGVDGQCTLDIIVVYDKELGWNVYNAKKSIPTATPW